MSERFLAFFSDFEDGFPPEIAACLREGITRRERLVFVCSDPVGYEKTDLHAGWVRGWLATAGIRFEECGILDDRIAPARAAALVRTASCLFLMGGQTTEQMRFMQGCGLVEPIRQSEVPVLGLSAGAINMATLAFTLREPPYPGLALADITVTPHFEKRRDNPALIEEIKAVSFEHPIYAMCDGSAIFARGEKIELLGEIYNVHHGNIEGASP